MRALILPAISLFLTLFASCSKSYTITSGKLQIEINHNLETKITSLYSGTKPLMDHYVASEYLECKKFEAKLFSQKSAFSEPFSDVRGGGMRRVFKGIFKQDEYSIEKILEISVYDSFPDMAFYRLQYVNIGERDIEVEKWVNNSYRITSAGDTPAFWSFQGSSTNERKDWILPVDSAFSQSNFLGMNNSDYGGGIPMVDLWRKDGGISIGHTELIPRLVSLPIEKDKYDDWAQMGLEYDLSQPMEFAHGDTLKTVTTFVAVHTGDCFNSLQAYSKFMQASGVQLAQVEPEAYEAVWCGWGYEQRFTVDEIMTTLKKVKELGIKWIDIDYGFQQALGDWSPDRSKFPHGSTDMRNMVNSIHAMGLKAKLWWAPLTVDPNSQLLANDPDIQLLNIDYVPQFITFWNSYYMSPAYEKTIQHTKETLKLFLEEWDFDGLKMDGMHINCVPPDYNPEHNLSYPEQSSETLPEFFKMVYETARSYKPHAVLQNCPCGCAMSFFNMPWVNQTVASDPKSSWQIRLKGKTYKALLGKTAYYGDHIELSTGGDDFASQVGVGAVIGTKFTWPKDNPYVSEGHFVLTPQKEKIWKKWIDIYNQKMISKETYLGGLYDIGYDKPETHVIQKADTLYYAFYSPHWDGEIELRGLKNGNYRVYDYIHLIDLGIINSSNPFLKVSFSKYLLIEAQRID